MIPTATEADRAVLGDPPAGASMRVRKRDGRLEPVDLSRIVQAVERCAAGLVGVDPLRVATKTIASLCDGATTAELDECSIRTAAALVVEEPDYARLAGRLLAAVIRKEVAGAGVTSFSSSVALGRAVGLVGTATAAFVAAHAGELDAMVDEGRDGTFEYFGIRTLYDRYLLRHPDRRTVIEAPQHFFLRVACGLAEDVEEAHAAYELFSRLEYLPSSPTLFNSGTTHAQMSSCYLLDSPQDDLDAIYARYGEIAKLSKHAGGIGVAYHRIRSRGSLIRGTNGLSNGIVPFLKTLDASVAAVNQGGRRRGAACVYLETWHADIEEFLELRDNTGDENRRVHNLNLANWVPDLFMERVEKDWVWSLFDPAAVPELTDCYGDEFARRYVEAEQAGRFARQLPARQLYARMLRTLAQTGNGWMTFKDRANERCNQTGGHGVVHLSNLCTEILEVTDPDTGAVCNLGSVNLKAFVSAAGVDLDRLRAVVGAAVTLLDRVIDRNWYPTESAAASNERWRPVGLGVMGLQDVFFTLGLAFDDPEARDLSARIAEEVYFAALDRSCALAERHGPHPTFGETRAAQGQLQYDLWGASPSDAERFDRLKARIARHGLRNSLLVAIAPTATIASIAGAYECIEPQVSNVFKRETLSGEFLQVNTYLVRELQRRGLWSSARAAELRREDGSVQRLDWVPDDLKHRFRTAWELPMRSLVDMAAARGPFVDQSQSLNLFVESPTIPRLSSMYLYAWKAGLKTTYYLRSRPATRITPATGDVSACSLTESPESCEVCQ